MQLKLSYQLGLNFLDAHTLLSNEEHPELPDWRETIRQEVAAYIEATEKVVSARKFQIVPSKSLIHQSPPCISKVQLS